jgi:4-aminobutyrate aminotransferase/(S)-3-amino-2-methylpropionate transaminase
LAVLDIVAKENLVERANILGGTVKARLQALTTDRDVIRIIDVRGPGAMIAFDVVTTTGAPDAKTAKALTAAALKRGLVLLTCGIHGNTIRLLFPLNIPEALFAEGVDILERCLRSRPA